MKHKIVKATLPDDYEMITAIHNAALPDNQLSVTAMARHFENPPEKCRRAIFLAYAGGEPVGTGSYWQDVWAYAPHNFRVHVNVRPPFQRRGLGRALSEQLEAALAPHRPRQLLARAREDHAASVRFLEKRGYEELDREWESELDPAKVDAGQFNGLAEKLEAQGITIKTLAELRAADPDCERKIYQVDCEASRDIPLALQLTQPSFAQYQKDVFASPHLLPEAFFVAVDGDTYAGLTNLRPNPARDGELLTGFTGVARAYRRRGIATALKLRAIAYAQAQGNPTLRTWNARHNEPMLAINDRLGFVRQPAWIWYQKEIGD